MIGMDDRAALFDPDEFGVEVAIEEPGNPARVVCGMWSAPAGADTLHRANTGATSGGVRVAASVSHLQLFNEDVPRDWRNACVIAGDKRYSITALEPVGRLRTACTLTDWGDRQQAAQGGKRGEWLSPRPQGR